MEKVLEIYNNIKDRLSNPFLFSFVCSWLVYNWRIPVALIWYDKSQFSGCGCNTIFDFISFELSKTNSLLFPLFFAFVYSLGIPYVKNFFRIVSARAQKWGENEEIKALDGGKIGVEKYLKLRENYREAIKKLENVNKEEKEFLKEKEILLNEINGVREELNQKINDNGNLSIRLASVFDSSILDGNWILNNERNTNVKIKISYRIISIMDESGYPLYNQKIKYFYKKDESVFFILETDMKIENGENVSTLPQICDLKFEDENILKGKYGAYNSVLTRV